MPPKSFIQITSKKTNSDYNPHLQMIKAVILKYKNLNLLVRFIVNIVLLSLIWLFFYSFLRYNSHIHETYEYVSNQFTYFLLLSSKLTLSIFDLKTEIVGKIIRITGTGGVLLDRGCLGRNLMGLFAGFILAYPSKLKHKLWAIPLGLLIIILLNIIRISALTYLAYSYPEYVDINHHVIFQNTVYFFIFCMWYLWIKYYSSTAKT